MRFRKTLTLLMLAMGLVLGPSAWGQQEPFTRDQVQGLVRDGLGDESGAKLNTRTCHIRVRSFLSTLMGD